MLAQQHMAMYDALRAGTSRNHTTISAAASAIGSTPTQLILTYTGDGIWSIGANLTTASNILTIIPPGVTVNVSAGVTWTMQGPYISYNAGWKTGSGTVTQSLVTTGEMSGVNVGNVVVTVGSATNTGVLVQASTASTSKRVRMFTDQGGGNVGISMSQNETNNNATMQIAVVAGGGLTFARPGGGILMQVNENGVGIGSITPATYLLQAATGQVAMPGGGPWLNSSSDRRAKTVTGTYTRGASFIKSLPSAYYYQYNGKADTPNDGRTYVGFIADDVEAVAPTWVNTREAKLDPGDLDPVALKTLDTNELLYALFNAVREHDDRLAALETPAP